MNKFGHVVNQTSKIIAVNCGDFLFVQVFIILEKVAIVDGIVNDFIEVGISNSTSDNQILTLSYPYVASGFPWGIRITK